MSNDLQYKRIYESYVKNFIEDLSNELLDEVDKLPKKSTALDIVKIADSFVQNTIFCLQN